MACVGSMRTSRLWAGAGAASRSSAGDREPLDAVITDSDGWGYDGYRYTAVLTLQEQPGPLWLAGTYADLQFISPGGDAEDVADTGLVTGSIDSSGRVVIELLGDGNSIRLSLTVGAVASGFIDGTFGCCGTSGTFTAVRR